MQKKVRNILDKQDLHHVTIFSSGSIDEHKLNLLLQQQHAPIDGFGIGTLMDTSADAPYFAWCIGRRRGYQVHVVTLYAALKLLKSGRINSASSIISLQ